MPLFGFIIFAFFGLSGFLGFFDLALARFYPTFVLEVASTPSVFDADVCFVDFALEPLVKYLLLLGGLVHVLDLLVVIAEVGRLVCFMMKGLDTSPGLRLATSRATSWGSSDIWNRVVPVFGLTITPLL